ncbi:MAG: hypothetical protein P8Y93_07655 [Acidobacteriota bacterium]|jgi:hypothetical protein
MALLHPKNQRRKTRLRAYTIIECPHNGHQVSWCRGLCEPIDGQGDCGRLAPHSLTGRTQAAIAAYVARSAEGRKEL